MREVLFVLLCCSLTGLRGQENVQETPLHNYFTEKMGNFSVELLHATSLGEKDKNVIIAPVTIWSVLAVMDEGANGNTSAQISEVARLGSKDRKTDLRRNFTEVAQYLMDNTTTVQLELQNVIFVDKKLQLEKDYVTTVKTYYKTKAIELNFADGVKTAKQINDKISLITQGRIKKFVDSGDFAQAKMLLISALYFKGQWTAPFEPSATEERPFHNSEGKVIGKVNMMSNRYTYAFANIKDLEARVIEIPYGKENRLSMLVMLPNPYVSLESMFLKFTKVPLDTVFQELQRSKAEYGDEEVDCLIPRFKIETNVVLNNVLQNMGVKDMFDPSKAWFGDIARQPLYVSKMIHRAEIEVTEEGTTGSAITAAEFANRIGIIHFEANRPFAYMIVEKTTNAIVFGGLYRQPSLY